MQKNKNYKMLFPKFIYAIGIFAITIALATLIFNLLKLFNVGGMPPYNNLIDTVSITLAIIIASVSIYSLIFSRYSFKEKFFSFQLSLFSVKIDYENLLLLRHDRDHNLLLLYYNDPKPEQEENIKYLIVNIRKEQLDEFVADIRYNNRRVIYEIFNKNKEG